MAQGKHSAKSMGLEFPKGSGDIDEVGEGFDPFDGLDLPDAAAPAEGIAGDTAAAADGDGAATADGAQEAAGSGASARFIEPASEDGGPAAPDDAGGSDADACEPDGPEPADDAHGARSVAPANPRRRHKLIVIALCAVAVAVLAAIGVYAHFQLNKPADVAGQDFLVAVSHDDAAAIERLYAGDAAALESLFTDELTLSAGLGTAADVEAKLNNTQRARFEEALGKLRSFTLKADKWGRKDDNAFVDFTISTYDFGALYKELMRDYLAQSMEEVFKNDMPLSSSTSAQQFAGMFCEKVSQLTERSHVATARVYLHRQGLTWKVDALSADALDALSGGLASQTTAAKAQL